MHLAISLSGEGSGHATRIAALGKVLSHRHRLSVWSPHNTWLLLQRCMPEAEYHPLPAIPTVYSSNAVNKPATLRANAGRFWNGPRIISRLAAQLHRCRVDAVIADYEPFLPRAAIRNGLATILFNHQGMVNRHPEFSTDWLVACMVNALMMPRQAGAVIISSFYDGDVGPLLRPEITERRPGHRQHICVYARNPLRECILPVLGRFTGETFIVLPNPDLDLPDVLADCRGVIAPAGHQLMSEALYLGKPILAFPQTGQYEQVLNARMLVRSGWGMEGCLARPEQSIAGFLDRLDAFPLCAPDSRVRFRFEDDSEYAARFIELRLSEVATGSAAWRGRVRRPTSLFKRAV